MKIKLPSVPHKPKPTDYKWNKKKWAQIRADWFAKNLDPTREGDFTYKDVALLWEIPYETVLSHAKDNKWTAQLHALQEQMDAHAAEKLVEGLAITEADIRIRQQKVASDLIEKAYAAFQAIDPTKISTKDATNLMRLALTQERAAVGLPDRIDFQDLSQPTHADHESPLAMMKRAQRKNALADKLLAVLGNEAEEAEEDTEAEA